MSNRTLRVYTEQELAYGRRSTSVLAPAVPTVDCSKPVDQSDEEPLMVLPQGWTSFTTLEMGEWVVEQASRIGRGLTPRRFPISWERMTVDEIAEWSTVESARRGHVQKHGVLSGQGCPKGDFGDEPTVPVKSKVGCPVCGGSWDENLYLESEQECSECGYGSIESHEYVTQVPLDEFTDRWTGTGPRGSMGMYHDHEQAAERVTYVDGEPVSGEVGVVEWDAYPAGWDRPLAALTGAGGRWTPREKAARNSRAYASAKRVVRERMGA